MAIRGSAANILSTWFGCGYAPAAPGTLGSAAAIGIAALIEHYAGWKPLWFAPLAVVVSAPAIWAAGETARQAQLKDPGFVVVDEVVGQWLALSAARSLNWKSYLAAFLLFRLFDIWKPWPVRWADQNIKGGLGVMTDDMIAGLMAGVLVALVRYFFRL